MRNQNTWETSVEFVTIKWKLVDYCGIIWGLQNERRVTQSLKIRFRVQVDQTTKLQFVCWDSLKMIKISYTNQRSVSSIQNVKKKKVTISSSPSPEFCYLIMTTNLCFCCQMIVNATVELSFHFFLCSTSNHPPPSHPVPIHKPPSRAFSFSPG